MADSNILSCKNLSFSYPNGPTILKEVSLNFLPGTFVFIQGSSGSGKSTFLRLLIRLEEPTQGTMHFKGKPLSHYPPPVLRRSIIYIQQSPTLVDGSIKKNLLLPFTFHANKDLPAPDEHRLKELLQDFLLTELNLSDNALSLSVGQRQRLCLMRALLLSPDILLLDEPVSALDGTSRQMIMNILEWLNLERFITIFMVSHVGLETKKVRPRVLVLNNGRMTQSI